MLTFEGFDNPMKKAGRVADLCSFEKVSESRPTGCVTIAL
jgi:hypothetical protein